MTQEMTKPSFLRIDFINVGDGDAILVREYHGGKTIFTLLVDCGLREIPGFIGSRRQTTASYLETEQVKIIDLMIVTHLHKDHFGGIPKLQGILVRRLISSYFPDAGIDHLYDRASPYDNPSVQGMYDTVFDYIHCVRLLEKQGCRCEWASAGEMSLTPGLMMSMTLSEEVLKQQKIVFRAMESGIRLPESVLYTASKERNNASLRIGLSYVGRRVLLGGDAYGAFWEDADDALPCDVLKVPHHGDTKSVTPKLLNKLHPSIAVITGLLGATEKQRPAQYTVDLLQEHVQRIVSLENAAMRGLKACSLKAALCIIDDSGRIKVKTLI